MIALTHKLIFHANLPIRHWIPRLLIHRKRRRAMLDLMHGNAHLRHDIGLGEASLPPRRP